MPTRSQTHALVRVVDDGRMVERRDTLTAEEPLEIRLRSEGRTDTVAVTMRTPGNDFELAAGFLFAEGVIANADEVARIEYCTDKDLDEDQRYNVVTVTLRVARPELGSLERHFFTSSACGVCGKAGIDKLEMRAHPSLGSGPAVAVDAIRTMPERLRAAQRVFDSTGGLHAAALFDADGEIAGAREDVGRHNAVDKIVGAAVLKREIPLHERVLMVSGRASFEIVQKALVAGIPVVGAVSAPSDLAVELATRFGMTLVGFMRGSRFNIYSAPTRIVL